jgi:two-component sensor histidine kinase
MIMQVLGTFQEGTSKIPGLSDEEREKRELTVRLAIDETLTNAVHYGLLGVTSEERVRAFMFDEDEPELNRIIDQKITSAVAARRRGSIEIAVFPDRVDLTLHDGTPFADFKTRWAECHRSADEEGVERLSGRGLHLLQSFGFQAHQAESGAVTYSLSYAALKA